MKRKNRPCGCGRRRSGCWCGRGPAWPWPAPPAAGCCCWRLRSRPWGGCWPWRGRGRSGSPWPSPLPGSWGLFPGLRPGGGALGAGLPPPVGAGAALALVAVVKAVPVVSFIILALIFLSSENLSLLISGLMVFPPVYLNLLEGIEHADRQLLEMARVFGYPWGGSCGHLPAGGAALFPLRRVPGAGPLLEVRRRGGGHRPARRVRGRGAVHRQGVLPDRDLFAWTAVIVAVSVLSEKLLLRLLDAAVRKAGG